MRFGIGSKVYYRKGSLTQTMTVNEILLSTKEQARYSMKERPLDGWYKEDELLEENDLMFIVWYDNGMEFDDNVSYVLRVFRKRKSAEDFISLKPFTLVEQEFNYKTDEKGKFYIRPVINGEVQSVSYHLKVE